MQALRERAEAKAVFLLPTPSFRALSVLVEQQVSFGDGWCSPPVDFSLDQLGSQVAWPWFSSLEKTSTGAASLE